MRLYVYIGLLLLNTCSFSSGEKEQALPPYEYNDEQINGLTFVAAPRPYSEQAMKDITSVHANWISDYCWLACSLFRTKKNWKLDQT